MRIFFKKSILSAQQKLLIMKAILILCLAVWNVTVNAQAIIADPALGQITIANIANQNLPNIPPSLPIQIDYILKVPIKNLSALNSIPPGSAKVRIGFGSKLILIPTFNLATANTSNYFNWTLADVDGQFELTGDGYGLIPLPPGYSDTAIFLVKGIILGGSTLTANFLVTNHNTPVTLSDDNGSNNNSSQFYIITAALPVTFTGLFLKKENCGIAVHFTSENEINLNHYEVEYSSDAVNFIKAGNIATNTIRKYNYKLKLPATFTTENVFVRIKSIDNDGRFQYSEIKMLKDLCDEKAGIFLYPNPIASNQSFVTIANKAGRFVNGIYIISLLDFSGKLISTVEQRFLNVSDFKYNVAALSAGNYLLKVAAKAPDVSPTTLKFQKLN